MRYLLLSVSIVGCGMPISDVPQRPAKVEKVDDGLTSDEELIRFKDDPAKFEGKVLKFKAKYGQRAKLSNYRERDGMVPWFTYPATKNGNQVTIEFYTSVKADKSLPDVEHGDECIVEIVVDKITEHKPTGTSLVHELKSVARH